MNVSKCSIKSCIKGVLYIGCYFETSCSFFSLRHDLGVMSCPQCQGLELICSAHMWKVNKINIWGKQILHPTKSKGMSFSRDVIRIPTKNSSNRHFHLNLDAKVSDNKLCSVTFTPVPSCPNRQAWRCSSSLKAILFMRKYRADSI